MSSSSTGAGLCARHRELSITKERARFIGYLLFARTPLPARRRGKEKVGFAEWYRLSRLFLRLRFVRLVLVFSIVVAVLGGAAAWLFAGPRISLRSARVAAARIASPAATPSVYKRDRFR